MEYPENADEADDSYCVNAWWDVFGWTHRKGGLPYQLPFAMSGGDLSVDDERPRSSLREASAKEV